MNRPAEMLHESDLEKLRRLQAFSWLSPAEIGSLGAALVVATFKTHEAIFPEPARANEARILLSGIVRITCLDSNNRRATVALIAPRPVPELPAAGIGHFGFGSEAYNNCRVGTLDWDDFERIADNGRESAYRRFHQNDLKLWYRLLRRTSSLLSLDLHRRLAITMLDFCDDFGIEDARGILLSVPLSHKDIASIVGASRPRVTEHLGRMEREQLLFRQGRQFIVSARELSRFLAGPSLRDLAH